MNTAFATADGRRIPGVTADEMRAVDRTAVDEVGLGLLQMMENAGRNLAAEVIERFSLSSVTVLAGAGGNGGGGLCAARHLRNHGVDVTVVLDRPFEALEGAPAKQFRILDEMDIHHQVGGPIGTPDLLVDSLIGYGLSSPVEGMARKLLDDLAAISPTTVSLDVPSGIDATTGDRFEGAVGPDVTLTLALPKTGLSSAAGRLVLADIGIPKTVFSRAGIDYPGPFGGGYRVPIEIEERQATSE